MDSKIKRLEFTEAILEGLHQIFKIMEIMDLDREMVIIIEYLSWGLGLIMWFIAFYKNYRGFQEFKARK